MEQPADEEMVKHKEIMPPTYFWIYLVLSIGVYLVPFGHVLKFPYDLVGIVLIAVGLWLGMWVEKVFKQAQTTVKPYLASKALVIQGPFRFSRNPMYLGMVVMLLGVAVVVGSWLSTIGAIAFFVTINQRFVKPEEDKMLGTFGLDYIAYQRRVRRWL